MALLDMPYYISGGAALDADNVPLGRLPIALLYENSIISKYRAFRSAICPFSTPYSVII